MSQGELGSDVTSASICSENQAQASNSNRVQCDGFVLLI